MNTQTTLQRGDYADKSWLAGKRRARMDATTFVGVLIAGGSMGVAVYDWIGGSPWAHAIAASIYQVGAL